MTHQEINDGYRLGFSVFLNTGNTSETMVLEMSDYLPEACQINLDYAGNKTKRLSDRNLMLMPLFYST